MTLSVWTEYYDFFIITIGIIVGMILAYFIFFKPRRNHSEETIEYVEPVSNDLEEPVIEDDNTSLEEELETEEDNSDNDFEDKEYDEVMPNEFEMGENSNIFESIETEENILDEIPEGIELIHEDDEIEEPVEEIEEEIESKVQMFGKLDLRPEIDPEQQIDEIIEDVLKISEQKPAQAGGKYHVLFKKDTKQWYVKREGETEKSKFLVTQGEAIAYATINALENKTTIVVHDEDGRIAKYKF